MEYLVNKKHNKESNSDALKYWQDNLVHEYYIDYYNNLSSKELDREFRNDIRTISKILAKLSDSERKLFIGFIPNFIEFYIGQKFEKEIDSSLSKILKFL